jgi:glutamate/tyrosine decarboxylase-like PLP-dependent enzyme
MADRTTLPKVGTAWDDLRRELEAKKSRDVDWRSGRAAVYIHFASDAVTEVAKQAYGLFFSENALGSGSAFPSLKQLESDVVGMALGLLQAPATGCGNVTAGGTESIFLAVKAARDRARARRPDIAAPTLLLPQTAHPAFDKAAHYLAIATRRIPVGPDFRADAEAMAAAVDENTIMIVGSAPAFPHGVVDPIEAIAAIARRHDLWCHVDACVGGFSLPFVRKLGHAVPAFDFSVPGVTSMSADLHKYGFTAKGASTVLFADPADQAFVPYEFDRWPRGRYFTYNFSGTRPGGAIAAAWAVMNFLGEDGYLDVNRRILEARERIREGIGRVGLRFWGKPEMGVFAYGSPEVDIPAVGRELSGEGWLVGYLQQPPGIHLMITAVHGPSADAYVDAVCRAVGKVGKGAAGVEKIGASYS